jgi:hypothetical protein
MLNAKEAEGDVIRKVAGPLPPVCDRPLQDGGLIDMEGSSEYDYFRRVLVFVIASVCS